MTEEFANFPGNAPFVFPDPEEVGEDYRMSRDYIGIPARSVEEHGIINDVMHHQADIVIDLVFEQLRIKSKIAMKQTLPKNFE
jgi:hypothetical protein